MLTFNTYQHESFKTWKMNYKEDFFRAVLGLFGEAGEIAEKLKKSYRDEIQINPTEMGKELGDCLYYLTRIAEYYGLTLEEVAEMNIKKLVDREKRNKIHGSGDNR